MATSTSLNLRALLKTAVVRSGMDEAAPLVSGLTRPAKSLYVAAAAQARPHAVVLYVVAGDGDLEQAVGDTRFFLAAMEGLSDTAAERAVLPFPSQEVDPYRGMSPHFGVTSARARVLHAIARGEVRVVVASSPALLPRVSAPPRMLAASIDLRPGHDVPPELLAELLVDAGFTREDPVDEHGEFTIRGGIVDIYPAFEPQPVRLEFIGDTIESMRRYDPGTQRSTNAIDQLTVVPLRDVLGRGGRDPAIQDGNGESLDRTATIFDYLKSAREARVIVSERDEVDAGAAKLAEQIERSYAQATGNAPADEQERDLAEEEWGELSEGDDDADLTLERAEIRARGKAGRQEGRRAGRAGSLPAPGELFESWDEIARRLDGGTNLVELGLGVEGGSEDPRHASTGPEGEARGGDHQSRIPNPQSPTRGRHVRCQPTVERRGRVADWVADIRQYGEETAGLKTGATGTGATRSAGTTAGGTTIFVAASAGRAERTIELLKEYDVFAIPVDRAEDAQYASVLVATGRLSRGFRLPSAGLQIFAEADIFEEERRGPERRRSAAKTFLSDLRDLKVGDLVVHVDHGIGVFVGLKQIGVTSDTVQEFLELRYAGEDKLFVPVERLDLVQKYTGATRPPIDRLGGTSWERAKTRVKKAMRDMAEELLKLYAARKAVPGHAFSSDSHWQQEFEDAFEYDLTPDQQAAVTDIKRDMESPTPMDRLLCGDVGYGKTEVAMRAAFKAVMDAKQVAFLAPTTVLAFQHQKTLRERFAGFPVRIDSVSRFRTKTEAKEVLAGLAAGKVDIIVGTHRLLSKDVQFRDLGLLVVDEEQRFGVAHKEKIKQLKKKVDVLTMTATPIPRTLNMSLVGIRDMSIIETPPKDRLSIQTNVVKFDQEVIRRAIRGELERGGQVYVVHNRVESIYSIGNLIQRLVPEARIVVGHGQMSDETLERAMLDFVARKFDVLVATTIVENGLDIPNANTIVINRADRYGLAQLYQLRGRVGRSDRPAYAYLLIPPEDNLSPVAKKRLAAIKEFSDLGSGFRVAALDLEIRGAGNLLGGEQSGQMETVGFEMYMKLLEQTVRELKGEEIEDEHRANVNLRTDLRIEGDYVPDMNQRLMLYRKVAAARHEDEIDRVLDEMIDRYGPLPDSVLNLADYGRIRVMADQLGVESIDREGHSVVLKFRQNARIDPGRLIALVRSRPELTLIPPAGLRLALDGDERAKAKAQKGGVPPKVPPALSHQPSRRRASKYQGTAPSWWTARAREDEIRPGFTKEEILKPKKEDPRAPGGVFERVGGLLADLLD